MYLQFVVFPSSRGTSVETEIGEMSITLKKELEQKCVSLYIGLRLVDVLLKELDGKKI